MENSPAMTTQLMTEERGMSHRAMLEDYRV